MSAQTILASGYGLVECPRWHDGALWFADWTAGQILKLAPDGGAEIMARAAAPPLCFDFAADGAMLVVASGESRLLRQDADRTLRPFAYLGGAGFNEIVVDGRGNAYVNGPTLVLVTPRGRSEPQASDFAFPNGMAVTPDNRTLIVAESHGCRLTAFTIGEDGRLSDRRIWADLGDGVPDGICVDASGAVWYADVPNKRCRRVREGGEVVGEVALDRGGFACMLGGQDRRTLYVTAASWFGMERMGEMAGSGRVLAVPAPEAGVGWP